MTVNKSVDYGKFHFEIGDGKFDIGFHLLVIEKVYNGIEKFVYQTNGLLVGIPLILFCYFCCKTAMWPSVIIGLILALAWDIITYILFARRCKKAEARCKIAEENEPARIKVFGKPLIILTTDDVVNDKYKLPLPVDDTYFAKIMFEGEEELNYLTTSIKSSECGFDENCLIMSTREEHCISIIRSTANISQAVTEKQSFIVAQMKIMLLFMQYPDVDGLALIDDDVVYFIDREVITALNKEKPL